MNHKQIFHTLQPPCRLLVLYTLIALIIGCSWTPKVETSIYEGPLASVSLITVSEESFEADHPVTLQTDTIAHILNGLRLRQQKRLLQKIFSSDNSSQPMFTQEQSKILTLQLQKAFSQVTPEEHVAFRTAETRAQNIQGIRGTMYVKGEDLYISLMFAPPGAHAATKTAGRGVRPDQEGSGNPVVVFNPKEALKSEKKPHWLFGGDERNHVVINVPLLASLHRQPSTSAFQAEQEHTAPSQVPEETRLPKALETSAPRSTQPSYTSSEHISGTSDTQKLLEEIRELRKELADQKKAIDRLEQEETKPR